MYRFALSDSCKHKLLATYFGDSAKVCEDKCASCVKEPVAQVDITKEAQMFLSAIYRTGGKFGMHHIIDLLRGSKAAKIMQFGHEKLSVYGIGTHYSKNVWEMIVDRLHELEALHLGEHRALCMTTIGADILRGKIELEIDEDKLIAQRYRQEEIEIERDETFERLKALRKRIALEADVPAYIVFSDKTLKDMAQKLPQSKEQMLEVHGIGEVKYSRYGEEFLILSKVLATEV
jgi:ATP-dependent DNA helicase RecQ